MTISKLKFLGAAAVCGALALGGMRTFGRPAARAGAGGDRAQEAIRDDGGASAALPGKPQGSFGGGPGQPLYIRDGGLFFVISPDGDKFTIYDAATKRTSTLRLPASKESPLKVAPIRGDGLVSLMLDGPKVSRIFVFSIKDWAWYPQDLREPASGAVSPTLGSTVASYAQGRYVYAFGAGAKRWGILELPAKTKSDPIVRTDSVTVDQDGRVDEFSGETGAWKHTDLRALIDAAVGAAKE